MDVTQAEKSHNSIQKCFFLQHLNIFLNQRIYSNDDHIHIKFRIISISRFKLRFGLAAGIWSKPYNSPLPPLH